MDEKKDFESQGIPEFDSAISHGTASFTQVVETIFHQMEQFNADEESRKAHEYYQPFMQRAFERAYGGITRFYIAKNIVAASVITNTGYFEFICPFRHHHPDAEKKLVQLSIIHEKAMRFLRGTELKECKENLYAASTYLIQIVDECAGCPDLASATNRVSTASELLEDVQKRVEIGANRNAQIDYLMGIIIGCAIIALFIYTLSRFYPSIYPELLAAITGGSLGAFVSVLTRITHGTLFLQYEVGRRLICLLGAFRPVIGAVMGVALWWLIGGGLLPIKVDSNNTVLFFSGSGFLAGFSERWAQDMLAVGKKTISGTA